MLLLNFLASVVVVGFVCFALTVFVMHSFEVDIKANAVVSYTLLLSIISLGAYWC